MEVPEMQQQRHHARRPEPRTSMRPTLWEGDTDAPLAERIGQRIIYGSWITVITAATLATAYNLLRRLVK